MTTPSTRRQFLAQSLLAGLSATALRGQSARAPRLLIRSSWATVNIGDIAHTPGLLRLLEAHLPEAETYLWPANVGEGVDRLLLTRFPRLRILRTAAEVEEAMRYCDFLIHGSKASVGTADLARWRQASGGKPYGIYGVTFPRRESTSPRDLTPEQLAGAVKAASGAEWVFFRDSRSLAFAREMGVRAPVMEFGPDAAFACDLQDPVAADAFLDRHGLETRRFLCCIPRLRFTPYWRIRPGESVDPVRDARNQAMADRDHAPLREAIVRLVRETDLRVLVCPEDRTQMRVGREWIVDRLPTDVRRRVVWRPDFWWTGEATSTYQRSLGVFGNEMHSPILSVGHGVPAIVCRWAEQTSKGYMWEDIGLGDWLFDLDDPAQAARVPAAVLAMATDPNGSRARAARARGVVERRQCETMARVAASVARIP